jgi:micrococcal nuclease
MKLKRIIFFLHISFFLVLQVEAKSLKGKVLSIHDGDTLTFLPEGSTTKSKLRLLGVDTPEIDFNNHSQGEVAEMARDYLRSLVAIDSTIEIKLSEKGMDSNNRYLGQLFLNGVDLNLEMLKAGWGAVYFIYPYDKKLVANYGEASRVADEQDRGIFSYQYQKELLPYLFRQEKKGIEGTNMVGNFKTKKLYSSENIDEIPHYLRVFFSSDIMASSQGFSW